MALDFIDFTADHSGTYTAGAGSDRLLVVLVANETGVATRPALLTSLTYGGTGMTKAIQANIETANVDSSVEIWYLKEASIPAGANSFVFTWNATPSNDFRYCVGTLEDVDQTTPILDSNTVSSSTLATITTPSMAVAEGGRVVGVVTNGQGGSYTWDAAYTELADFEWPGTPTGVLSVAKTTSVYGSGGTDTTAATVTGLNRQVLVAASFNPVTTVVEWLDNWACRRKFTISAADVDALVQGFPVRVSISTSSGLGTDDVSDIFDEVGANSLKIAVTTSNGTSQVFVEVEYWDSGTERGELWIKAASLSPSVATDMYLYFDNNKANNTSHVGVVGSTPAQSVWDANFVGVWHLAETTGNYLDSTSNGNDSSSVSATSRTTAGLITPNSMHLERDNTDTGIIIPDATELRVTDKTLEVLVNFESFTAAEFPDIIYHRDGVTSAWYSLELTNDPYEIRHRWSNLGSGIGFQDYAFDVATGWNYLAGTVDTDTTTATGYKNADAPDIAAAITNPSAGGVATTLLGGSPDAALLDGTMDEVRISNIARPEAWVDATYKTMLDNFITWSAKETLPPNPRTHQMML